MVDVLDDYLPSAWINSSVSIIFDFGESNPLYCLFPFPIRRYGKIAEISRKTFIHTANNGEFYLRINNFLSEIKQEFQIAQQVYELEEKIRQQKNYMDFQQ